MRLLPKSKRCWPNYVPSPVCKDLNWTIERQIVPAPGAKVHSLASMRPGQSRSCGRGSAPSALSEATGRRWGSVGKPSLPAPLFRRWWTSTFSCFEWAELTLRIIELRCDARLHLFFFGECPETALSPTTALWPWFQRGSTPCARCPDLVEREAGILPTYERATGPSANAAGPATNASFDFVGR